MVHGPSPEVGITLVTHPADPRRRLHRLARGGRTLFDAAALRPEPIPVYAEMGSSNPVFLLPGAIAERAEAIAKGLAASRHARRGPVLHEPGPRCSSIDSPAANAFLKADGRPARRDAAGHDGPRRHQGGLRPRPRRGRARSPASRSPRARRARGRTRTTEAPAALLLTDARRLAGQPAARRRDLRPRDAGRALRVAPGDAAARPRARTGT